MVLYVQEVNTKMGYYFLDTKYARTNLNLTQELQIYPEYPVLYVQEVSPILL